MIGEKLKDQKAYGTYLSSKIPELGRKLASREIESFEQLWSAARAVRCGAPDLKPCGRNYIYLEDFKKAIRGGTSPDDVLETKLNNRYAHIVQVIRENPEIQSNLKNERQTDILVAEALSIDGRIAEGSSETSIPLTQIKLDTFTTPYGLVVNWNRIDHTHQREHPRICQHLETLFRQIREAPDDVTFQDKAARLYWWSAHACLDLRGSAAKTEIAFRALYAARGLHCPLWKPGISADLHAMIRTEEQWLEKINQFRWSAPEIKAILGE